MIFVNCDQGTPEWFQARCGVITASIVRDALSTLKKTSGQKSAGDPTDKSDQIAYDLAFERISAEPYGDTFQTFAMKRGSELEAMARMRYESRYSVMVDEVGVALTDDRLFGYSADGLVGTDGLIEIKTPLSSTKIVEMIRTGDIEEYKHQIQMGLWITGRLWADFIMYIPPLKGVNNDLYVKRIKRDDNFIEDMEIGLLKFNKRVEDAVKLLSAPMFNLEAIAA